jgi:glycosyltransferase involved in cell wall biosynthesis
MPAEMYHRLILGRARDGGTRGDNSMTTFSLSRRRTSLGGPTRVVIVAGVAAVVGLAAGRVAISHYGLPAIELIIIGPILAAVTTRPFVGCLLLLVVMASVFSYGALPRVTLPGHPPINVADVLLVAVVGGTLWRRPWPTWPPAVRRFAGMLLILLLLALLPTIRLAVLGHSDFREAVLGFKTLLFVAIALTVALECREELWRPLINAAIAFAAIVAIMSLLAAAWGGFAHLLTNIDANAVLSASDLGGTARIRLQGLFFVYAMSIPTLVIILSVRDRWRSLRIAALLLMIAAIAVSLNRNMYFGDGVGLLVTILVGGPRVRHRVLLTTLTALVTLVIVVESAVLPAVTTEIGQRAQSALSSQVLSSNSAQARSDEFTHALTTIGHNPWYGVGWFQPYGSLNLNTPRLGVEDWYLDIATDLGIPVALAWLLVPGSLLWYAVRRARLAAQPAERALVAAGAGSVTALLLSCLVGSYLQDPDTMLMFGLACGFLLAAALRARPREISSGSPSVSSGPDPTQPGSAARPGWGRPQRELTGPATKADLTGRSRQAHRSTPEIDTTTSRPTTVRVAVTCNWFLKYAAEQSAGLARAGADVLLLCRTHPSEFAGNAQERAQTVEIARRAGVRVIEIPGRLSDPRVAPVLWRIRREIAHFAPEIIHAHDGADPRALALLPHVPTVLTLHDPAPHPGQPVPDIRKGWLLIGSRDAWRARADVIVVHSARLQADVELRPSQRCVVVAHGLSIQSRPLLQPSRPTVGFFGRLAPYKGLDVLARAMPRVWATRPEVQLKITGSGDSGFPLVDARVQLERRYLPEADVARFFTEISLAVLPYTHASQTGAGSLAVGYGVPVVASRLGGLPDLMLDQSYGFESGDHAGLADAIVAHIDDGPEVRERILAEIAGPRSWDSVSMRALACYQELLTER